MLRSSGCSSRERCIWFVPVAYCVAGGGSFVLDLEDLALRQVRAGIPAIAPDGSWVVTAEQFGDRGATSIELARPQAPSETLLSYAAPAGSLIESWEFLTNNSLILSTRPEDLTAQRTVHLITEMGEVPEPILWWGAGAGWRPLLWITSTVVVAEERASRDHLLIDLVNGEIRARVRRPSTEPVGGATGLGWIEDNIGVLIEVGTGDRIDFETDAGPTLSSLDHSGGGCSGSPMGLTTTRSGCFTVEGAAVVGYDTPGGAHLVRLDVDGSAATLELPANQRVVNITATLARALGLGRQ